MDRDGYAFYGTAGFTAQMTPLTTNMLSGAFMNAFGAALREPLKMIACLVGAGLICWRLLLLGAVMRATHRLAVIQCYTTHQGSHECYARSSRELSCRHARESGECADGSGLSDGRS